MILFKNIFSLILKKFKELMKIFLKYYIKLKDILKIKYKTSRHREKRMSQR